MAIKGERTPKMIGRSGSGSAERSRFIVTLLLCLDIGCAILTARNANYLSGLISKLGYAYAAMVLLLISLVIDRERRAYLRTKGAQLRRWAVTLFGPVAFASILPLGPDFALGAITAALLILLNGLAFALFW